VESYTTSMGGPNAYTVFELVGMSEYHHDD
jgi:hypothetical protein